MSQKTNSMIKLALVFFICLLSFSIGTYVGKKYSDNQYKLSQLEPNKKNHDTRDIEGNEFAASTDSETETITAANIHNRDSQKLTDQEVARIAEEFAADSSSETAADEKPIQTAELEEKPIKTINSEKAHKPVASTTATRATAENLVPAKTLPATATTTTHDREPSSIPPTKAGTSVGAHYTLQIGSFPLEADAQKMTKEMLAKGIKTSYVSAQVNGQTYYRVNVGLFGTVREADEYKKDFLEKTKLSSAFVQKVAQ